jgi:Helix-turn-helix.
MLMHRFGEDARRQRLGVGFSQRQLALLVGVSHAAIGRIERGEVPVDLLLGARLCSMLGMELGVGCHPIGSPARDKGHLALLERFHGCLPPSLMWRTEDPLPIPGDLRALDAVIRGAGFGILVEAETHLTDVQATLRKIHAKQRDAGLARAILLLNDTRHNRAMVASSPELRRAFPLTTRRVLAALAQGHDPGGDGIVFI